MHAWLKALVIDDHGSEPLKVATNPSNPQKIASETLSHHSIISLGPPILSRFWSFNSCHRKLGCKPWTKMLDLAATAVRSTLGLMVRTAWSFQNGTSDPHWWQTVPIRPKSGKIGTHV